MSRVRAISLQISDTIAKGYHKLGVPSDVLSTVSTMGIVTNNQNSKFGDYQCNSSMSVYSSLNKIRTTKLVQEQETTVETLDIDTKTDSETVTTTTKKEKKKDKKKSGPVFPTVDYTNSNGIEIDNIATYPASPANLSSGVVYNLEKDINSNIANNNTSTTTTTSTSPIEKVSVAPAGYINFSITDDFIADRLNTFFVCNDAPRLLLLERDMHIIDATSKQSHIPYPISDYTLSENTQTAATTTPTTTPPQTTTTTPASISNIIQRDPPAYPRVMTIDYSSPNVAKQMHVGHIRSTCIGDSIARIIEFSGLEVYRMNHLGDWGTQFGMLITHLQDELDIIKNTKPEYASNPMDAISLTDLQTFYRIAKKRFDDDADFHIRAKENVVKLQSGDVECTKLWNIICAASRTEFRETYKQLHVDKRLSERGESFYNPLLKDVVEELLAKGVAIHHQGAIIIPPQESDIDAEAEVEADVDNVNNVEQENDDGEDSDNEENVITGGSVVLVKTGGGFTYGATDMAALRFRLLGTRLFNRENNTPEIEQMASQSPIAGTPTGIYEFDKIFDTYTSNANVDPTISTLSKNASPTDWAIYIVDAGQSLHFQRVMRGGQFAGWVSEAYENSNQRGKTFLQQVNSEIDHILGHTGDISVNENDNENENEMINEVDNKTKTNEMIVENKNTIRLEHVPFGVVLGSDNKRLRTRAGQQIKLQDLINESTTRSATMLHHHQQPSSTTASQKQDKNEDNPITTAVDNATTAEAETEAETEADANSLMTEFTIEDLQNAEHTLLLQRANGLGSSAIKYADQKKNRILDYVFSFDAILDFKGDTAAYLLYANARLFSLLQRAGQLSEYSQHVSELIPASIQLDKNADNTSEFDSLAEVAKFTTSYQTSSNISNIPGSTSSLYEKIMTEFSSELGTVTNLHEGQSIDMTRVVSAAITQYTVSNMKQDQVFFNAANITANNTWIIPEDALAHIRDGNDTNLNLGHQEILLQNLLSLEQNSTPSRVVHPALIKDITKSYINSHLTNVLGYTKDEIVNLRKNHAKQTGKDEPISIEEASEQDITVSIRLAQSHQSERALILQILRFHDALIAATASMQPQVLCDYLYQLSTRFSSFYRDCSVLNSKVENATIHSIQENSTGKHVVITLGERDSRIMYAHATSLTMRRVMKLLGLQAIKHM